MKRKSSTIKNLSSLLGKNKWIYLISSILFIGVIFFRVLEPKVFEWTINSLVLHASNKNLGINEILRFPISSIELFTWDSFFLILIYYSILYLIVTLLRSFMVFTANVLNARSTEDSLAKLRDRIFNHLQKISVYHYIHHSKGEMIQRSTNDIEVVKSFVQGNIVEVIRIGFMVFFSLIMIFQISPILTIISVCLMPIVVIMSLRFYTIEKRTWEFHEIESDKLNTLIQENIQGIRTIKAYALEDESLQSFHKQNEARLSTGLKHNKLHATYWPLMNLIVFVQIVITNLSCIWLASKSHINIGEVFSIGLYANMMLWPIRQVSHIISNFSMASVALSRIEELLSIPIESSFEEGLKPEKIEGKIEFRNVSFQYPGQQKNALTNVSFIIHAGEKSAIIGPTGSGKSTILKLIIRLYDVSEGEIYLDNRNIKEYSKKYLREKIGVALQNSILFSASIKENLKAFKNNANTENMKDVMELACIDKILGTDEKGFEHIIGEKGINLSGGQKQRMAIARLLIKPSDIYILDDVTSYIDELNEQKILQSFQKMMEDKTCLIISHKLSTIIFADKIIVLQQGRVIQQGDQKWLAKEKGYFNIIYTLQTEKANEPALSI